MPGPSHTSPSNQISPCTTFATTKTPLSEDRENTSSLDNAVLDSMHISTTESILQWPHFDVFPSLREDVKPIFSLERGRPPMVISQNPMYPYVDTETVEDVLDAFQKNVNFWYPTLSQSQMQRVKTVLRGGVPSEESVLCCLTLLIMALGCVSQAATSLRAAETNGEVEEEKQWRLRRARMGNVYFQLALKKLHIVHLDISSESTQCLFFTRYVLSLSSFVEKDYRWY